MAELEVTFGDRVDLLVGDLNVAGVEYETALAQAARLEDEAATLRDAAPGRLDVAIAQATSRLLALADSKTPDTGGRKLLEGVLEINQHRPSGVTRSGPPDIAGTLSVFDELIDGAPALIHERASEHAIAGVVTDHPVLVEVSIAQGMGGLPQADIMFGFERVIGDEVPTLSLKEEVITQSHCALSRAAIGARAIQGYIDSLEFQVDPYKIGGVGSSGHEGRMGSAQLEILAHTVSRLKAVGVGLDTTHMDAVVQEAVRHRVRREDWIAMTVYRLGQLRQSGPNFIARARQA